MDAIERVRRFFGTFRGETLVYGRSALGAPLVGFFVGRHEFPVLLLQYALHAREWVTSLLALEHAARGMPRGGAYILPLTNPDGAALALRGEDFLRALPPARADFLRRVNGGASFAQWKANANAVDLNVNFPARWGTGRSNVFRPAPQNFVGRRPLSEPESRALAAFTERVRPDATVSYHTKGREIYWEFFQPAPALRRDEAIARALAEETGYAARRIAGSAGGYKDWCVAALGVPAFTIEAGDDALAHPLGEDVLPALLQENIGVPARLAQELTKWKKK